MYPLKDDGGRVKCFAQWPQVAIAHCARKLAQQFTRLEQEFGMPPSTRTRIQVAGQPQERSDAKATFFSAG